MNIQTYKLWLEPDTEIPELMRLKFNLADVNPEDVFLKGIHPHSVVRQGGVHDHTQMTDVILAKLNEPAAYPADLGDVPSSVKI